MRVHYKRYLQSFEELHKTLGCTMLQYPRGGGRHSANSSRVQIRGKHRSGTGGAATPTGGGKGDSSSSGSNLGDLESSDKSSVGSQDDKAHAALNIGELLGVTFVVHCDQLVLLWSRRRR